MCEATKRGHSCATSGFSGKNDHTENPAGCSRITCDKQRKWCPITNPISSSKRIRCKFEALIWHSFSTNLDMIVFLLHLTFVCSDAECGFNMWLHYGSACVFHNCFHCTALSQSILAVILILVQPISPTSSASFDLGVWMAQNGCSLLFMKQNASFDPNQNISNITHNSVERNKRNVCQNRNSNSVYF